MNVLIVYCHPEPASFNAALKDVAKHTLMGLGHRVEVSDLYGEGFDPVEKPSFYPDRLDGNFFSVTAEQRHAGERAGLPSDVEREIARLERADLVILQFPLWWHAQPAMLKGWFDRVFVNGRLYSGRQRYDRGYFCGKRAFVSITTGAPEAAFAGNGRGGDMNVMLWPIQYSLYYMGFTVLTPFIAHGVQNQPGYTRLEGAALQDHLEERKAALASKLQMLDRNTVVGFPGWGDWDESGHAKPGRQMEFKVSRT